jgi:hypothetical protein
VHDDGLVVEVNELPIDEQCRVSAATAAKAGLPPRGLLLAKSLASRDLERKTPGQQVSDLGFTWSRLSESNR